MNYDIKRSNGSVEWVIKTVTPTGSKSPKAMAENVVDMAFTLPNYVEFKINDFVVVYGDTYKINITPSVKKVGKRKFEYQIQFEHLFYDLAKVQLQGLDASNGYLEPVFNIMGNAATIVGLVVESANRHSPGWTVGIVDDTSFKNYSFNAENCLQVLSRLADENDTEFWIDNKTIHLQKRELFSGLQFEYGQGGGLYDIARTNKSNTNILTRLYVRGGSRNLPSDYRNHATSLLLPGGLTYIQDNAKVDPVTGYGLIESTIVFDDIFPQREGTISAVLAGDDDWDKFSDASLDFDVNAYKLATPAKVAFNTGQLAGYEFELSSYNHATKQFTIKQNTDEALKLPTSLIRPAVGDKYVLLDIKMPQSYIDAAEAQLFAAAQAYYNKNSDPKLNFSYAVTCDPIWFKEQNVNIVLGNTVVIYDADLGINGQIRIAGYKRDLQIPSKYELEISDSIGVSEIVRQYAQQKRTLQLLESSGLLDINQIRKNVFLNRLSESDGYLLLAGTKIKAGFSDYANDAGHANIADYAWDADKWDGRQFADYLDQSLRKADAVKFASVVADTVNSTVYVSGFTGQGYRINPDGSAEFDSLTVRKELNINVLNVREITGSGGSVAITNVAKIKEVTDYGSYYQCKINTDDNTIAVQLRPDDIIRCQVWDGKKLKFYTAKVNYVADSFFEFFKGSMTGTGIPQAGDTVFQFGNTTDVNRQGLIYLTNSDTGAPYMDVLDGITSDNLAGKTKVRLGKLNGINDADFGQLEGYGIYAERAFIKGKVVVTGGNAETVTGSQSKADTAQANAVSIASTDAAIKATNAQNNAITQATTQAAADAAVKSSAAQVAAIQAAANDAAQRVLGIKIGGKNLVKASKQTLTGTGYMQVYYLSEALIVGETYTATLNGVSGVGAVFQIWVNYASQSVVRVNKTDGVDTISNTFIYAGIANEYRVSVYSEQSVNPSTVNWIKIEKGNKATDWTPAPEDATADAQAKADAAQLAATNAAYAQAAYEREVAKAYADGIVDAEEAARIAQAATNLQTAKDDATAKVNTAIATANGYTDSKALATISAAQIYADNSATSKANAAQANAISQASTDAQNKADAAQAAAAILSQQLVNSINIGGRNYVLNSKFINGVWGWGGNTGNETITIVNGKLRVTATQNGTYGIQGLNIKLPAGKVTLSAVLVSSGNSDVFLYENYYGYTSSLVGNKAVLTFDNPDADFNYRPYIVGIGVVGSYFEVEWIKWEAGSKATDWTPATEDVQAAIDLAKSTADTAQANYNALTANLKSLAYQDVVELAKLGTTIVEGGKIKTTLLDADYIRANIVDAAYINTLSIDANAIKSGIIDSARINASQIISNGGGATASFVNNSISTATSQAAADATVKASAAQVAAIQAAANDATAKINGIKIGGKNLVKASKQILIGAGQIQVYYLSEPLVVGETYTATLNGISGVGAIFQIWVSYASQSVARLNKTDGVDTISNTFIYAGIANEYRVSVYSEQSDNPSTVNWIKIEKGNKATDWTPAPEDATADAQAKADAAQLAATNAAYAQAAYEREVAKAYADGIVDAEEAARIAQAATNLQVAKDDATAKVNTAIATANGYTDTKALATISAAQIYADNSATSKANAAQANAISQASTDAQNKANAAQAAAAILSQQLVNSIKLGGRNLVKLSKQTITGTDFMQLYYLSESLIVGETYTATLNGVSGVGASFQLWVNNASQNVVRLNKTDGVETVSNAFVYNGTANEYRISVYSEQSVNPSTVNWVKIEKGNKATDWTPATEDVQAAIDLAKSTADTAQANYNTLTANLKSLAYQDVVELAKLGTTIVEGGKIKTTLLDADYIRANIINAAYINTLEIITQNLKTKATGKRVEIDSVNNNVRILDASNNVLVELDDDSAFESFSITNPGVKIYGPGMRTGSFDDGNGASSVGRKGVLTNGFVQVLDGNNVVFLANAFRIALNSPVEVNGHAGLNTVVNYKKANNTNGTLTFENGILTGQT
ncbi:hypothetical protein DBR40_09200 [Pedobacter sp. KBW01]|uniref:phage tail protein n=1 Tax=Pedobacter sp. KBW01 TaxID=2153364 RepID=UPI000F58F8A7|nr:phage tail protein [Pedobacter sp. KBW01]RQO78116.1 hypothetical protein DBR40_09200 [Pedobacter sp. KBW01]